MNSSILTASIRGLLALGLVGAFTAAPVQAQQQPAQEAPQLSEQELQTFAEAYVDIGDVRMEMQTRLQNAENEQEASQIQQQANAEMEEILNDHGLSVQEYQEMTQVLNSDPEQRQEFQQIVEELQGGQGGAPPQR